MMNRFYILSIFFVGIFSLIDVSDATLDSLKLNSKTDEKSHYEESFDLKGILFEIIARRSHQTSSQPFRQSYRQSEGRLSMHSSPQLSQPPSLQPSNQPLMQPISQSSTATRPLSKLLDQPSTQLTTNPSSQSYKLSSEPRSQPLSQPSSQPYKHPLSHPPKKFTKQVSSQPSVQSPQHPLPKRTRQGSTEQSLQLNTPPVNFEPFLKNCILQLPVAQANDSSIIMIKPSEIMTFSSENFYGVAADESLIFFVADNGATTQNSPYSRCELRHLREWTMQGNEIHALYGSLKILEVPASGRIIFSQIHGSVSGAECLKVEWDNGRILIRTKATIGGESMKTIVSSGLNLGDLIEFSISISNYRLSVTVNGVVSNITFDNSWTDKNLYFKAGNYLQDSSDSGTFGKVAYYMLSLELYSKSLTQPPSSQPSFHPSSFKSSSQPSIQPSSVHVLLMIIIVFIVEFGIFYLSMQF